MRITIKTIIPCAALSLFLTACSGENGNATTESNLETSAETVQITTEATTETTTELTTTTTKIEVSPQDFVSYVKVAIEGDVGKNESITDVVYDNGTLTVCVDLENAVIPNGFTNEDIALSRVSSITDSILELPNCDDLWNEIIIDFGDIGKVKNTKANIVDSEYGRYFDNFKIEK